MSTEAEGGMRARDLDRANARAFLDAAYAEGQLDADEYHDRTALAGSARTMGHINGILGDLQKPAGLRPSDSAGKPGEPDIGPPVELRESLRRLEMGDEREPRLLRARDSDRARASRLLDVAAAQGQLTIEEHGERVDLLAEATTIGEIRDLTSDLRPDSAAHADGLAEQRRRMRSARIFVGLLLVIGVAVFLVVGFVGTGDEPRAPAAAGAAPVAAEPDSPEPLVFATPDLMSANGLRLFVDNVRKQFGDAVVDEVDSFGDYAVLDRQLPGQPNRSASYNYRGGFTESGVTTRPKDTGTIDLATVDLDALERVIVAAPTRLAVPEGRVSHLSFGTDLSFGTHDAVPEIAVYVGNDFGESGHLTVTPSGEIVDEHPFDG
ncbi:DUF1707 SHOCT-like domain-containing protein [Nocardia callitridis]|uniref:DUF1707 domain-containing protein n=1 Tax=Nocardia callitridis TaxID=648753 RepID=A0ABP9JVT3_9NOCA